MEGKLIKRNGSFYLMLDNPTNLPTYKGFNSIDGTINENLYIIGTSVPETYSKAFKLSIKNCQAIEFGYDLDELVKQDVEELTNIMCNSHLINHDAHERSFIRGFQKALELMGDKKFSEVDIRNAMDRVWDWSEDDKDKDCSSMTELRNKHIRSLQQTEWDVEIGMEGPLVYPANLPKEGEERPDYRPKFDSDGCLILKRL